MPSVHRALPVALLLCLSSIGRAEDLTALSLEELMAIEVISTPQFAGRIADLPASVTALTAEDFRVHGWRTLADALRSVRGFNITYDRVYSYAGVRGLSPPGDYKPRLIVLIDGINTSDNIFGGSGFGGEFQVDVDLIERVEIVRGPSGAVFGGNAMGGVVNIITRGGAALHGTELAASAGSFDAYGGRASIGGVSDSGLDYLVSVNGYDAKGDELEFPEFAALGYDTATDLDDEERRQLFAKLGFAAWRATLIHSARVKTIPTGKFGAVFNDPAHQQDDSETLAEVAHTAALGAATTLNSRVYAGRFDVEGSYPQTLLTYHINRLTGYGEWWGAETRLQSHAWDGHALVAGADFQRNEQQNLRDVDVGYGCIAAARSTPCLDDQRDSIQWSLYAQDEMVLATQTRLTFGLRLDRTRAHDLHWSPRLGLVQHTDRAGTFKLLYATAFREPSAFEKYAKLSVAGGDSSGLDDEFIRSLEGIWEYSLGQRSQFTATLYQYRAEDIVAPLKSGLNTNLTPIRGRGAEFELNRRWAGGAALRASYVAQFPELEGERPANAPQHMLKLNASAPLGRSDWHGGVEVQGVSQRGTEAGTRLGGYGVANLNVIYAPPAQPWDIGFGIYNLFDRSYGDPIAPDRFMHPRIVRDSIEQDGRAWRVKLTWRL